MTVGVSPLGSVGAAFVGAAAKCGNEQDEGEERGENDDVYNVESVRTFHCRRLSCF